MRWRLVGTICWIGLFAVAEQPHGFGDHPVALEFHGSPAVPLQNTPNSKRYRTKIRQAATNGPNFADHYTLAVWGCGAGCVMFSVVDSVDGRVYDAPFTVSWFDANLSRNNLPRTYLT